MFFYFRPRRELPPEVVLNLGYLRCRPSQLLPREAWDMDLPLKRFEGLYYKPISDAMDCMAARDIPTKSASVMPRADSHCRMSSRLAPAANDF